MATGGSLKAAMRELGREPFLMLWGDVLIDIDLGDFINFYLEEPTALSVALTSAPDPTDYGSVRLHGDRIVEYVEKPRKSKTISHLVSAGVHIVDETISQFMPKKSQFMLEKDVIPELVSSGQVKGYLFEGQWFDVGTPEIYKRAIQEWSK